MKETHVAPPPTEAAAAVVPPAVSSVATRMPASIAELLARCKLTPPDVQEDYVSAFFDHGYEDVQALCDPGYWLYVKDEDLAEVLKDVGMSKPGHCKKLLKCFEKIRGSAAAAAAPPPRPP